MSRFSATKVLGVEVFGRQGAAVYRRVKVLEFFDCPGSRQGVEDLRELFHKELCLIQCCEGAQGDRKAEVFQVSNGDTVVAQRRLEDKQLKEKTNTDCLSGVTKHLGVAGIQQQNGLVNEISVTLFAKVRCFLIQSGLSKIFWAEDTTMSTYLVNRNMGFNESREYKKTFIGSGVGTGLMQVLHGFEFEVEPLGDHTFEVEPQENVDQGAVATVEKIYAHESLTFNNIVACEVNTKWKAGLKDDMDAQSDVYVLNNGCRKCSDDSDGYYWEYTPAKGHVLGMKIIRDQSGNTLRVLQSKFYNRRLVQTLLEGHPILSLEGSLSGDCDVKKNGSLKANLQYMEALSITEVGYMTFTEAWKKEIWLKGLFTESRMGRAKLRMELIKKGKTRITTYHKRKLGILKKASEFSILCDVDTIMIITPPNSSEPEIEDDLMKARKKNIEAKYSTWFDVLDSLSEHQLRQFVDTLEPKENEAKTRLEFMKRSMNINYPYMLNFGNKPTMIHFPGLGLGLGNPNPELDDVQLMKPRHVMNHWFCNDAPSTSYMPVKHEPVAGYGYQGLVYDNNLNTFLSF
nr:transcription factor, MADS-box [Tanacetum cinerariifolium]